MSFERDSKGLEFLSLFSKPLRRPEYVAMSPSFGGRADGPSNSLPVDFQCSELHLKDSLMLFTYEGCPCNVLGATACGVLAFCLSTETKGANITLCDVGGSRKWGEACGEWSGAENAKLFEVSAAQGLLCNFPRQDPTSVSWKNPDNVTVLRQSLHAYVGAVPAEPCRRAAQPWGPHGSGSCPGAKCGQAQGHSLCGVRA